MSALLASGPRPFCWAACAALASLAACAPAGARNSAHLAARIFHAPRIEVHVAQDAAPAVRAGAERLAERWTLGHSQAQLPFETRVLAAGERGSARVPRVVLGRPGSAELAPLLARLGAVPDGEGGFRYLERELDAGDALVATFEDPARPGWPVTLVAAGGEAALAERLALLEPVGWPGARVFQKGELAFELLLGLDGAPARATRIDRLAGRQAVLARSRALEAAPPGVHAFVAEGVQPGRARRAVEASSRTLRRARALAAAAGNPAAQPAGGNAGNDGNDGNAGGRGAHAEEVGGPPPILMLLVGDPATMVALHGRAELAVAQPRLSSATLLVAPGLPDDGGAGVARAALVGALGAPAEAWMAEAAAVEAAGEWWGVALEEWGAHLRDAALLPGAATLVHPTADRRISPHVLVPGRALLVRYLRREPGEGGLGDAGLGALWRGELAAGLGADERAEHRARLLSGFEAWLGAALHPHVAAARDRRAARRAAFDPLRQRRGIALDSRPVPGGLLPAARLGASLSDARARGANAMSQVAYFSEHPPAARFAGLLSAPRVEPLEGDPVVAQALGLAREARLGALLRPVLLLSDSASYSGWAKRTHIDEWARHFEAREAALLHAALLAELSGAELLAIGGEEGDAGRTAPDGQGRIRAEVLDFRRERWRAAIDASRRAFSGGLTFVATPVEAEHFELWNELDLATVLFHPRLVPPGPEPPPTALLVQEMIRNLQQAAALGERFDRPVLIGEVAFRSTAGAWRDVELGFGELDLGEQARLFGAFFEALEATQARREPHAPPLAGYYVFGWGPDPAWGGRTDRGYSPQNKPAADLLFR